MTDNLAFLGDSQRVKLRISSGPLFSFLPHLPNLSSSLRPLKSHKHEYEHLNKTLMLFFANAIMGLGR
jgi:hypothetical protein